MAALEEFTAPGVDRLDWLKKRLDAEGLPATVLDMAGSRNLMLSWGPSSRSGGRQKCLAAHYDRHPRSPGANDNSAACLQLLDLALALHRMSSPHDCIIVFTDNEELAPSRGMEAQGAFALAEGFRRLGLERPWVFSLDCTGRGDRLILSSASELALGAPLPSGARRAGPPSPALKRLSEVEAWTASLLGRVCPKNWERLPTPHSDGLTFLLGGMAAATITLLPSGEADAWRKSLEANPALKDILLRKEYRSPEGKRLLDDALPDTWKRLHSARDDMGSLDADAFRMMRLVLQAIAAARLPG